MTDIPYVKENLDLDSLKSDQRERIAKIITSNVTLQELIVRYDKSLKGDTIINDDYWDIPLILADRFGLVRIEDINKSIEELYQITDHLDAKFRNHRHEMSKNFSGKPE